MPRLSLIKISIQYYAVMISIFEPHKSSDTAFSPDSPIDIISTAKACFETLLRLYHLRHGFDTFDFALLQYLPQLAFSSLRDAEMASSETEQEALYSTQLLCAKGLWDQGKNMMMCQAIFDKFRHSLKNPELQRELSKFAGAIPDLNLLRKEMRSTWPVGVFASSEGGIDRSIGDYLNRTVERHQIAESSATAAMNTG